MRVLLTGARGLLGAAIAREFSQTWTVTPLPHAALDVSDEPAITAAFERHRPQVVINCAAYNKVDAAEDDPQAALQVNSFGVLNLSRAAQAHDAAFVHYSTDFVFDGNSDKPYTEADVPNPRGVYAASKLLGDWFALESPNTYVLRVESLFGEPFAGASARGSLGTLLRQIRQGLDVPVFVDRTVSPSYTSDVARATGELLSRRATPGLYHCVNTGAATWADIAREAGRLLGMPVRLKPITLESVALKAPRPRYCALSNAKLAEAGCPMPTWQSALARHLNQSGVALSQDLVDQRTDSRGNGETGGQAR